MKAHDLTNPSIWDSGIQGLCWLSWFRRAVSESTIRQLSEKSEPTSNLGEGSAKLVPQGTSRDIAERFFPVVTCDVTMEPKEVGQFVFGPSHFMTLQLIGPFIHLALGCRMA